MEFIKSSFCTGDLECVEVTGFAKDRIIVRDSKQIDGPNLVFTREEWDQFILGVKAGEFDLRQQHAQDRLEQV